MTAPADPSGTHSVIGRVINNYEIKSVLAEGGMGKVYLAEHPFMGRRAAIKVLRGIYLEDTSMVTRFVNEARAANAIHHPNIVEIIDVGYLPDGPPYLMMEFLEGETLQQRLTRVMRLPPPEAVRILDQAASALEAAHAAGIIHRDLKPDNLFLIPDPTTPGADRVKVVDFGIAKLEGPGLGDSVRTTGVVLGTPHYMSPEQCRGTSVDHRTDIYALGAILYQVLCGRPPFVGDAQIDVMMMHVVKIPAAPRELYPEIPAQLEAIALRALAKRPEERFASMADLRAALRQLPTTVRGLPLSTGGLTPSPVVASLSGATEPVGSRRWGLWVSLAIAVGIGVGWVSALRVGGVSADGGASPRPATTMGKLPIARSRAGVPSAPVPAAPSAPPAPTGAAAAPARPAAADKTPAAAAGTGEPAHARPSAADGESARPSKQNARRFASSAAARGRGAAARTKGRQAASDSDRNTWMNKW
ncbi:MAG TPA: serine/threonine-protein kinase [Polyangia bacterium]|nr:serine/threonine-protein kinase [Polyangia bacterium]